jgi:Mrp family chromosome partitioning ATPase
MDADVYGPDVPLMMGINRTPMAHGERIQPLEQFGVKLMSMSFMNCPHCHKRIDVFSYGGGGKRQRDARAFSGGAAARPWRCASEALPASLWRCEPFLELARNTLPRTNKEAGKSGPTFEVSE